MPWDIKASRIERIFAGAEESHYQPEDYLEITLDVRLLSMALRAPLRSLGQVTNGGRGGGYEEMA